MSALEFGVAGGNGLIALDDHVRRLWHEQVFVAHLFRHPQYGNPTSALTQLPLDSSSASAIRRASDQSGRP